KRGEAARRVWWRLREQSSSCRCAVQDHDPSDPGRPASSAQKGCEATAFDSADLTTSDRYAILCGHSERETRCRAAEDSLRFGEFFCPRKYCQVRSTAFPDVRSPRPSPDSALIFGKIFDKKV